MEIFTQLKNKSWSQVFYGLLISFVFSLSGFSQNVGINATGTPPNASAGLDVDFPNMGLLIPRIALTGTTNFAPLSAHVAGMVIYNTAIAGDVIPGFYYNNGSKWIPGFQTGNTFGNMLFWNGAAWVIIPAGLPGQYLQMSGASVPTWGGVSISTLSIAAATAITGSTATTMSTITSDGGSPIISRGICYKTTSGPTIADSKTVDGVGIGLYPSYLTGLLPATTYYIKAYAINSTVNVYGNEISFTTTGVIPTLGLTNAATLITASSATCGGTITTTGGSTILERGLCYSTTPIPSIANSKLVVSNPALGPFSANITGLAGNTIYYVSAYATNSLGTAYGTIISFTSLINVPTVVTTTATLITASTATAGGSYSQIGTGGAVMNTGLAYSTVSLSASPLYINNPTNTSPWLSNMTGLSVGTTYYVRSYINFWGATMVMIYGNEISFTTGIIQTASVSAITKGTAVCGGSIIAPVGTIISARGVCWDTKTGPTIALVTKTLDVPGLGTYASNITGLAALTPYFVRAYCTDNLGVTTYGDEFSFTTQPAVKVGDLLLGGIVYKVDATGAHGFIAATVDQNPVGGIPFGCNGTVDYSLFNMYTGLENTARLAATCPSSAANLCFVYTAGGTNLAAPITNWYCPGAYELGDMLDQRTLLTLSATIYWSSTAGDAYSAFVGRLYGDVQGKWQSYSVRAIRRF